MKVIPGNLTHPAVQSLLQNHLDDMHKNSPEDSSYALDLSGLQADNISFWTAWDNDELLGCGALKELSPTSAEIKSMRTHAHHLRKGVAAKILEHIIETAKRKEYTLLSLETGTGPAFEPSIRLYRKYGFERGELFSGYKPSPFNQFFHLKL